MVLKILNYWEILIHKLKLKSTTFGHKGYNVQIYKGFNFGHSEHLKIHDNVIIGINAHINAHGGVTFKSGTITGPDLMIYSVNHIFDQIEAIPFSNECIKKEVIIGQNCWIGGRVFIAPGVNLGDGCIVAGGSVVSKSFPACSVIGGNPARILKMRDEQKYVEMCKKSNYCLDITRNKHK
ncbi:MAG: acyltransferase [Bacteroidota bacterium]|nr:acyltransferase [Bacteroidota bacterium]